MLLAATLLTGNTGIAQSQKADLFKKGSVERTAITVKAKSKKSTTTDYNKRARKAYKKFLKGYYEDGKTFSYGTRKFNWWYDFKEYDADYALYDINNDGKDELILNTDDIVGSSDPNAIFTYYKGKVKCIGISGHYGYYWGHKKGKLIGRCYNHCISGIKYNEGYMTEYSVIKKGKLKVVARFFDNEGWAGSEPSDRVRRYWIGKKRVSKKKFQSYLKRKTGSKNPKTLFASDKYVTYKK